MPDKFLKTFLTSRSLNSLKQKRCKIYGTIWVSVNIFNKKMVVLVPGVKNTLISTHFLKKKDIQAHWGHGGCWGYRGCWGHWALKTFFVKKMLNFIVFYIPFIKIRITDLLFCKIILTKKTYNFSTYLTCFS